MWPVCPSIALLEPIAEPRASSRFLVFGSRRCTPSEEDPPGRRRFEELGAGVAEVLLGRRESAALMICCCSRFENWKSSGGGEPDVSVDMGEPGSGEFMATVEVESKREIDPDLIQTQSRALKVPTTALLTVEGKATTRSSTRVTLTTQLTINVLQSFPDAYHCTSPCQGQNITGIQKELRREYYAGFLPFRPNFSAW